MQERGRAITITKYRRRGFADHHQDWGALGYNTGVDLKRGYRLGRLLSIWGTHKGEHGSENKQPLQSTAETARLSNVNFFLGASFIAPIAHGDFAPTFPQDFLGLHARQDQIYNDVIASEPGFKEIRSVEDLWGEIVHKEGTVGIIKSVEGLSVTQENYKVVIDTLKCRGVRYVGFMWNFDTEVGATTAKAVREPEGKPKNPDMGLSELGREVVRYLDQQDIMVDVSHASDKTIADVLDVLKDGRNAPIATHSGSRAVHEHNRNITDEFATEIVSRGGIIGIPFVGPFIGPEGNRTVDAVVSHIKHFKELGLIDGIVLGSDFNGMADTSVIDGVHNVTVVRRNLTKAMRKAGFSSDEIEKVLNRNAFDFWLKHLPSDNPPEKLVSTNL